MQINVHCIPERTTYGNRRKQATLHGKDFHYKSSSLYPVEALLVTTTLNLYLQVLGMKTRGRSLPLYLLPWKIQLRRVPLPF